MEEGPLVGPFSMFVWACPGFEPGRFGEAQRSTARAQPPNHPGPPAMATIRARTFRHRPA